jgi:hypothetical protein
MDAALSASGAAAATSTAAKCAALETCYLGGSTSTPCTIADGGCAPCVTFDSNDGCYVKVGGECPFGVDCQSVWYGSGSGSSASGSGSTTTSSGSTSSTTGSATTASSTTGSTATSSNATGSTSSSGSAAGNGDAGDSSSSGGSDMSVVFAIIGAAIGVIAVAVIFLTLVRRSRAAREDDDDMANTPPAFAKNNLAAPSSTTGNAAQYASYGRATAGSGASSTGIPTLGGPTTTATMEAGLAVPSSGVMSYYSQQPPQNSAAPSPRVAGRAFPSAAPMGVGRASQPGVNYANAVPMGGQATYQPEPMKAQAPPTPLQPVGAGMSTSPRTRRESYEF